MGNFDEAAFKQRWREICAERHVDPEHGATVYQVIDYKAEQITRQRREQAERLTWASPAALDVLEGLRGWPYRDYPEFEIEPSAVERAVLGSIRRQARDINAPVPEVDEEYEEVPLDVTIRQLWREVQREIVHDLDSTWQEAKWEATTALVLA